MKKIFSFFLYLSPFLLLLIFYTNKKVKDKIPVNQTSGAGEAFDAWTLERLYPTNQLPTSQFYQAFEKRKNSATSRQALPKWDAIGPKNIAGRTLALAFHPTDPDIIFLGSASGGLWKTTTGGLGATAWERIPTGFPLLGVGAIAINPDNPAEIFIGTGEVYNDSAAEPGIIDRLTRGTYGIGILKSEDGGRTWSKSLDWTYQNFTGIQEIVYHPQDTNILFAATTKGLYQTTDGGQSWTNIHSIPMAVDIAINRDDPMIIFVSHGSLFSEKTGIFRSRDGGKQFEVLSTGLPNAYTGKAMLTLHPTDPTVIYASVANAFGSIGLYRSTNNGGFWGLMTNEDVAKFQGWYSHDVAINPSNPEELVYVGIDSWHSQNEGRTFTQQGNWERSSLGRSPIAGPDGPPDYVHADIHRAYYHPLKEDLVFLATDGGVFVSEDGGLTFQSRNGGLQTTQFYANFSNSTTDSLFAIGGMQDNWTAIYDGEDAWIRVLGGDGMTAAINPLNDSILYGSAQFGYLSRSTDRGQTFSWLFDHTATYHVGNTSTTGDFEFNIFSVPFEIAPSFPSLVYTGNKDIIRSYNGGISWEIHQRPHNRNNILNIAVSPLNENLLLFSTIPSQEGPPEVYLSEDGGRNASIMNDLPDLVAKDFAFHPTNDQIMYAVFSGYGSPHVWKTEDGGTSWQSATTNLPDLPYHSILVDPLMPDHIYVGNDLGIYFSENAGTSWEAMTDGLPEAIYAIHLSYAPTNRKIRVATHGNGVYEAPMVFDRIESNDNNSEIAKAFSFSVFPNPTVDPIFINISLIETENISLELYNIEGKLLQTFYKQENISGNITIRENLNDFPSGVYFLKLYLGDTNDNNKQVITKKLIKE